MKYRKLRIAWLVAWGVVAVLLIVLWMRSYWRMEWITLHCDSNSLAATSMTGAINFSFHQREVPYWDIKFGSRQIPLGDANRFSALTLLWNSEINLKVLVVPHWLLAAIVILGSICWPSRFSLRAMLIATTLVAVGLGLIVWLW